MVSGLHQVVSDLTNQHVGYKATWALSWLTLAQGIFLSLIVWDFAIRSTWPWPILWPNMSSAAFEKPHNRSELKVPRLGAVSYVLTRCRLPHFQGKIYVDLLEYYLVDKYLDAPFLLCDVYSVIYKMLRPYTSNTPCFHMGFLVLDSGSLGKLVSNKYFFYWRYILSTKAILGTFENYLIRQNIISLNAYNRYN